MQRSEKDTDSGYRLRNAVRGFTASLGGLRHWEFNSIQETFGKSPARTFRESDSPGCAA